MKSELEAKQLISEQLSQAKQLQVEMEHKLTQEQQHSANLQETIDSLNQRIEELEKNAASSKGLSSLSPKHVLPYSPAGYTVLADSNIEYSIHTISFQKKLLQCLSVVISLSSA